MRVSMSSASIKSSRARADLAERHEQIECRRIHSGDAREHQRRVEHTVDLHRPAKFQVLQNAWLMIHRGLVFDPALMVGLRPCAQSLTRRSRPPLASCAARHRSPPIPDRHVSAPHPVSIARVPACQIADQLVPDLAADFRRRLASPLIPPLVIVSASATTRGLSVPFQFAQHGRGISGCSTSMTPGSVTALAGIHHAADRRGPVRQFSAARRLDLCAAVCRPSCGPPRCRKYHHGMRVITNGTAVSCFSNGTDPRRHRRAERVP